jgi:hypothetical protein
VSFWLVTQQVVTIPYRRFGTIGREMSARNYLYSLYNNSKERSSHLLRCGNLKSRMFPLCSFLCSPVLFIVVFGINGSVGGSGGDDGVNYPNMFKIWRLICVE